MSLYNPEESYRSNLSSIVCKPKDQVYCRQYNLERETGGVAVLCDCVIGASQWCKYFVWQSRVTLKAAIEIKWMICEPVNQNGIVKQEWRHVTSNLLLGRLMFRERVLNAAFSQLTGVFELLGVTDCPLVSSGMLSAWR